MTTEHELREAIHSSYLCDESAAVRQLIKDLDLSLKMRKRIQKEAIAIVKDLRAAKTPGMMETFMAEYGLTTEEGVALMCLAEALLRVPDETTIDALIEDKIAPANWSRHLGHSTSPLVNTSTWALMLTGKVVAPAELSDWDIVGSIRQLIKRAGEPLIRKSVSQSMKILGHQFVLGREIDEAMKRAKGMESKGYTYSYDMLGESARTQSDARRHFMAYTKAIATLSDHCPHLDIRKNPAISVKLSALHPRYEYSKKHRIKEELIPRVASLVHQAKNANMGFTIDAEEIDRLSLSLDVIEGVLSNSDLAGWDGFGVVVQTYGPQATGVLDWLYDLAKRLNRKIMVRLVKGAYWDAEIKNAQIQGLEGYAVFTRKESADVSYLACAKKMLEMADCIYSQFATHNAYSAAAIIEMAGNSKDYEFQRLHGMGESLYSVILSKQKSNCRIYAPVGIHEDLLAYLVRRLLENGANSSFVHQVLDENIAPEDVVADPIEKIENHIHIFNPNIPLPLNIFEQDRINSRGWNLANPQVVKNLDSGRNAFLTSKWQAAPIIGGNIQSGVGEKIFNPSNHHDVVGEVVETTTAQIEEAFARAHSAVESWQQTSVDERAHCLDQISKLYEEHYEELIALACREAGKTILDGIAEVREAVDFCRYYALQARALFENEDLDGRGVFACISPWNFPLAIFTGQVTAALVAGNTVIAKPAEQTPLMAMKAVELMLAAGIPGDVLQLLPGDGPTVGKRLVSDPRVSGVCFTGSTETAQSIHRSMADLLDPEAPLIAETGGMNAMIVDSSALPEQVVRDVVASAFQSAGQRCSALRVLYLQNDVAEKVIEMLKGAMDELEIGDPWPLATDIGPVIDSEALTRIESHCQKLETEGRLIKKVIPRHPVPEGTFIFPRAFQIDSIEQMNEEIFGPVLHIATFDVEDFEKVVHTINKTGYGLTMGIHSRVNHRVQRISELARVGNIYVNRNQIGAVVGVQPFGGEGLSGTGPKAGGPHYLQRFVQVKTQESSPLKQAPNLAIQTENSALIDIFSKAILDANEMKVQWDQNLNRREILMKMAANASEGVVTAISEALKLTKGYDPSPIELIGPTGESNQLSLHGRGVFLCGGKKALRLASLALLTGNAAIMVDAPDEAESFLDLSKKSQFPKGVVSVISEPLSLSALSKSPGLAGIAVTSSDYPLALLRKALANRLGPILPLVTEKDNWRRYITERALCIDTTASGGNPALLANAAIDAE
ncbi:MAG: bifunctional proline dehydrogenase/L-glutamate gamma-semialdehyde dehydrogenase PutA [SAR324 cluster bacterium]|nr:bifunctional proline dehydrogenase/L-glutamate gamma-semialdehyde dehydrogenase PutA [SAR324 cluster bacterium]